VTKFAPHKVLKLIACRNLTFDESVVLHRVGPISGDRRYKSNTSDYAEGEFKAHRLLYHSTLGGGVIQKKKAISRIAVWSKKCTRNPLVLKLSEVPPLL